jgi:1,4-alpha-glucan branching enzyme
MGWMNDTLVYMSKDPVHRKYHHDTLTFSMIYAFTENFLLPFSHDEVVHGKESMLHKMPGDEWQRFANLRLLYLYMFTHPGKKLLFMGTEFGQGVEWNSSNVLDWYVLEYDFHIGLQRLVQDLNQLYHQMPELYTYEFEWQGFEWIESNDGEQSVLIYRRKNDTDDLIIALNFTPVPRHHFRTGVPYPGIYQEIFNSDAECYGGSNVGNGGIVLEAEDKAWMERPYSITLTIPPLGGVILKPVGEKTEEEEIEEEATASVKVDTSKTSTSEASETQVITETEIEMPEKVS